MSRKDFIAIAAAIATITDNKSRLIAAQNIGKAIATTNFDYAKWYAACNVPSSLDKTRN